MKHTSIISMDNASANVGCSAVGMPESYWFIAIVKNNTELSGQSKLVKLGFEAYVPIQERIASTASGRIRKKKHVIIPTFIFINCTEAQRLEIVRLPFIIRFMVDRTRIVDSFNRHPIAKIPKEQIDKLKFMIGNADNDVVIEPLSAQVGDKVEIIRGSLRGLVGNVEQINNETRFLIRIDTLGYASVKVAAFDLAKI